MPKVAVIMGSDSDFDVVKKCLIALEKFDIEYDAEVISAHRNPDKIFSYVRSAEENGIELIIGAAGKAAHLPGVMAGLTPLPVERWIFPRSCNRVFNDSYELKLRRVENEKPR